MYYIIVHTAVDHPRLQPWNQDDVDCVKGLLDVMSKKCSGRYQDNRIWPCFNRETRIDDQIMYKKKVDKCKGQEITLQPRKLFSGRQSKREKLK